MHRVSIGHKVSVSNFRNSPNSVVTAGTATTTGTLFTETAAANTINYAASCTVTSVGANSFTAFTVATSVSSGHNLLTVTATSAPTASTAYQFAYNCK